MEDTHPQRRTIRHFNNSDAHELTFSCFHRRPFLKSDRTRNWFLEALTKARESHGLHLWAWVIMPEHVHLLVWFPQEQYAVEAMLKSLKQSVARKALNALRKENPAGLRQLATGHKSVPYRFWQDGPGYDRNLSTIEALRASVEYIHNNPVERSLVKYADEWPWSSYKAWEGHTDPLLPLDLDSFPMTR